MPSVPQDTEIDRTESLPAFRGGDEEFQIADTPRLDFRHLCRRERHKMQLVAQLTDADAYSIVCKVGRAHLDQIGDSLPGGTAEERHAAQILRRIFHDKAIAEPLFRLWANVRKNRLGVP